MILALALLGHLAAVPGRAQSFFSLQTPDSLHAGRLWTAAGLGGALYATALLGLNQSWYADYPRGPFHTFNDWREWNQMDKMGHSLMAYQESRWLFAGARWTGLPERRAAWLGIAGSQIIQTSIEVLDGFSTEWGFSWSDVGFNLLGSGLFLAQQLGWGEQRIQLKMSAWPVRQPDARIYPVSPVGSQQWTTLAERSRALYGTGPASLFLKNYNALVVWASVNPRAFLPERAAWWPRWLNLAAGLGADNLYAGTGYTWQADKQCAGPDCVRYALDPAVYPRTRQFFLSLDVDVARLGIRSRFWRTLLGTVSLFKFPAPALEVTSRGKLRFHPFFF